jgi:hypothetical protein
VNLRIIEETLRKSNRHDIAGPLQVHLLSFSDLLEWTCDLIVRRVRSFLKHFHVDDIVILTPFC